jgi:hypothetical protein
MIGLTWENFIPILITVTGGLLLWVAKMAINALAKSLTRKLEEEIERLKAEKEAMQKQIDNNSRRIDFLIEKLIDINS